MDALLTAEQKTKALLDTIEQAGLTAPDPFVLR
jgi:hypothetical protein